MKQGESASRRWLFATAVLDERSLTLTVNDQVQPLDPKPMEVLLHLLNHAGEVVTKDELLAAVWPGRILSDAGLTSCVARLRAALADDAQAIIKTVHGYGYRLVAPVKVEASRAPPPPRFDFKPGDHPQGHSNWSLVERLGTGGHGEVWLARHDKTGEPRIFKYALDQEVLPSLKREITLSRYLHDTLGDDAPFVRILDWNLEIQPYCIQAEYTQGGNLVTWAAAQGGIANVPMATRLDLAIKVAEALASAHAVGVLHKDLKPSNVLIDARDKKSPRVRLSDFGSGGVLEPGRLDALGITRLGLTMTQGVSPTSGTPIYLAPELIAEQPATMQTDIYAMGVLLYQLIVGDLKRPLAPGWEHDVEDEMLRDDIAAAAAGNPARRLRDAAALVARLKDLDQRRLDRATQVAKSKATPLLLTRTWAFAGAVALVAVIGFFGYQRLNPRSGAELPTYALAILPFTSPNAELESQLLADGWYEDMLDRISKLKEFRIASRGAAKAYHGKAQDARAVGTALRADTVLRVEVNRRAENLAVNASLLRTRDGREIWWQSYERPMRELFAIEGEILQGVAGGLGLSLSDAAMRKLADHGTHDLRAYDLYLQVRGRNVSQTAIVPAAVDASLAQLREAVAMDPNFAQAYATLAVVYNTKVYWIAPEDRDSLKKGFAAAERALGLQPDMVEAHVAKASLGMTPANGFDFGLGIREAKRALAIDGQAPGALGTLSMAYTHIGLFDEHEEVFSRILALNPQDTLYQLNRGGYMIWAGKPQQGLDILEKISPKDVSIPRLWYWSGAWGLMDLGRNMQAEARIEEFLKSNQDVGGMLTGRRALLRAVMGDYALAEKDIATAAANNPLFGHFHHTAYEIGATYAVMNRSADALKWLNQAANTGFPNYPVFARDRNLDRIRADPEFIRLMGSLRRQFESYRSQAAAPPD